MRQKCILSKRIVISVQTKKNADELESAREIKIAGCFRVRSESSAAVGLQQRPIQRPFRTTP